MSEEPKKIWVDDDWEVYEREPKYSTATPYIRADLVDGLVEALEFLCASVEPSNTVHPNSPLGKARAALKALEDPDV
jgi:hypothetical protein